MITVPSYAKINLGLRVTARRADGYHELDTVFQTVSLHDTISFVPRGDGRISLVCRHPGVPADETNLCWRAARMLQERTGCAAGVGMTVEKRIPVGAGLGGGSSNAAAVLAVLNRMWGCRLTGTELHGIAVSLGADVPFFLAGGTARATGIGDRLEPLEYDVPQWVVLKYPAVAVSTAWAYKNLKLDLTTRRHNIYSNGLQKADIIAGAQVAGNDFEPSVFEKYPDIAGCKAMLQRQPASLVMMSGSGSTVYGVFPDAEGAAAAAAALAALPGPVFTGRFVTRAEIAAVYNRALCGQDESGQEEGIC